MESKKQLNKKIGELADENDLLVRINKQLKKKNEQLNEEIIRLKKENEELRQTVQHFEEECGARENDLTIVHRKNKELQTENLELIKMNEQLRKINKTIGDDLYNCRLNKNTKINKEKEEKGKKHKNCVLNNDAKYPCKAYDECLARKGTNKPLPCMVNWVMGNTFDNMIKKEEEND